MKVIVLEYNVPFVLNVLIWVCLMPRINGYGHSSLSQRWTSSPSFSCLHGLNLILLAPWIVRWNEVGIWPRSLPEWPKWSSSLNVYKMQWSILLWRHMHLTFGEVEAGDLYVLEASLLYLESSRTVKYNGCVIQELVFQKKKSKSKISKYWNNIF